MFTKTALIWLKIQQKLLQFEITCVGANSLVAARPKYSAFAQKKFILKSNNSLFYF